MAASGGHGNNAGGRDGNRCLGGKRTKRHIEFLSLIAGVSDPDILGLGHDYDVSGYKRLAWLQYDDRRRRINDNDAGRRIHDNNDRANFVRRCRGTGTRPLRANADAGQLDEPGLHDIGGRLEHWLGVPMRPRAGHRSFVPGIRDACRGVSRWKPCGQRDGCKRAIGDESVQSGCANTGGPGASNVHMGR